jgi:hypothetical protein
MGIRVSVFIETCCVFSSDVWTQNRMVLLQNLCPSFICFATCCCSYDTIAIQPYEAFQARARIDHTSFSWYFDNFNLAGAANSAMAQDVAIVFLLSDSGEGYVTVDDNAGDRCASLSAGF